MTFEVGQHVHAKMPVRDQQVRQGDSVIRDRWRYKVTRVTRTRIGVDDGDQVLTWPAELFRAAK